MSGNIPTPTDLRKLLLATALELGLLVATRWLFEISTPQKDWYTVRNGLAWWEDRAHELIRIIQSHHDPRVAWLRRQFDTQGGIESSAQRDQ